MSVYAPPPRACIATALSSCRAGPTENPVGLARSASDAMARAAAAVTECRASLAMAKHQRLGPVEALEHAAPIGLANKVRRALGSRVVGL